MLDTKVTQLIKFKIFSMPCCGHQLCWVNPRLPTHCPECGKMTIQQLKNPEYIIFSDDEAQLIHKRG